MSTASSRSEQRRVSRQWRRTGYLVGIGINVVMIWVVANIVEWDIVPFLTDDFEQLETIAVASLVVGIVIYGMWLLFDPPWFRMVGDTINSAFAFVVILRTLQVFPFEFDGGFWTGATRVLLILVMAGTAIGAMANLVKLVTGRTSEADLAS